MHAQGQLQCSIRNNATQPQAAKLQAASHAATSPSRGGVWGLWEPGPDLERQQTENRLGTRHPLATGGDGGGSSLAEERRGRESMAHILGGAQLQAVRWCRARRRIVDRRAGLRHVRCCTVKVFLYCLRADSYYRRDCVECKGVVRHPVPARDGAPTQPNLLPNLLPLPWAVS